MRTTIRLSDDLFREARQHAAETGQTLTALIDEALRERLARRWEGPQRRAVRLPVHGRGGTAPGVDLDDSAELLDRMEAADASD